MNNLNENGRRRVVVTGIGALSPLGKNVASLWNGLVQGKSGIGPMTLCETTDYPCKIAGEVPDFDPQDYMDKREARRMARFSQFAVAAAHEAVSEARLDTNKLDMWRVGVLLGNGNGGFPTIEENAKILANRGGMHMSPFFFPMILPNMASGNVSRMFGAKGFSSTVTTACAAATQAIGEAVEVIRRGAADVMITGGTEAGISQLGLAGFALMRALSTRNETPTQASRPFDAHRDGFVPAEGAGIIVLEELEHALRRGVPILTEILGFGCSSDAHHPFQPDEDGAGASRAIQWTMDDADIGPQEVDYINAHGTSTPLNDSSETRAIKRVFGDLAYHIPISSTKSMIGHALGGAGGLEVIACVKTIQTGIMHPTINLENPDPACDLDYIPNKARDGRINRVLSNSFGFGGQNACLLIGSYGD